jgi:hypothetical protein
MKRTADSIKADIVLVLIPAPVQVCQPQELDYFPMSIDLSDSKKYDMDLPQRLALQIGEKLGIAVYDIRKPLLETDGCPYQPRNMHWLPVGHRAVAQYLAETLTTDGFFEPTPSQEVTSR